MKYQGGFMSDDLRNIRGFNHKNDSGTVLQNSRMGKGEQRFVYFI